MVVGQAYNRVWTGPRRRRPTSVGWMLTLNLIGRLFFPVKTFGVSPTFMNHDTSQGDKQNQWPPQFQHSFQNNWRERQWPTGVSSISQTFPIHQPINSFTVPKVAYLPRLEEPPKMSRRRWRPNRQSYGLNKKQTCDGKGNLLQDLGVLAIASGAVGTVMGIFFVSYFL